MNDDAPKATLVKNGHYSQAFCDEMTDAEATKLWQLHQEIGQEFDAVCNEYASTLGLEKSQLSEEQTEDIIDQVQELMDNYDEADTDNRNLETTTPAMMHLKRHHDLGLEIMNILVEIITRSGFEFGDDADS